jgi:hypothetical protein
MVPRAMKPNPTIGEPVVPTIHHAPEPTATAMARKARIFAPTS